ncbi:MAG: NAD(P)/FAD-dependent oxidoreductase [Xenophilus sp.]
MLSENQRSREEAKVQPCDVLVIGGGPGGSTVATMLARQGRRVVMLEKDHHPRFHIGESLLPGNAELFDRLGVREQVDRIGMPKYGIEFVPPDLPYTSVVEFGDGLDPSKGVAWQVRRSELDELLFRHAQKEGAEALEGVKVREVEFDAEGATVHAVMNDGRRRAWRTRFVVDASGRDTLLANRLGAKQKNPDHNSTALFGHFRNARRLEGRQEGHITICWFPHGWFWFIPLADGATSVGAVCWAYYLKGRDKPLKDFFFDTIALVPELADRLKDAELIDDAVHATGNFSYSSTHATGERYLMVGDAYTFIDPMFSTGVYLAMLSGVEGAEVVAAALDRPAELPAARARYEKMMRRIPKKYAWFIYRVTNPTIRDMFMHPRNVFGIKRGLLSLLAADLAPKPGFVRSVFMFKVVYYFVSVVNWRRTYEGWKRRGDNIRDHGPLRGETVMKAD